MLSCNIPILYNVPISFVKWNYARFSNAIKFFFITYFQATLANVLAIPVVWLRKSEVLFTITLSIFKWALILRSYSHL